MSGTDDGFTNEQLTELALMQVEISAQTEKVLKDMTHQTIAGLVMSALLLHELERLGLVDHDALMAKALQRTASIQLPELGAGVARVIETLFDGDAPSVPRQDLADISGPSDAQH